MKDNYILTAESVTAGHPDKLCDTIADSILDACLKEDSNARVACEVLATAGKILVAGELRTTARLDVEAIVRQTVRNVGYNCNYHVEARLHTQSPDIAGAVDGETLGAGDQGIMYGYPALRDFIRSVIVPEMQIKLKQGFGRAIRTETDTCVVAILDERCSARGRYRQDVLDALPEMPILTKVSAVRQFLCAVKPQSYFEAAA